jgi:hypothetical protein
MNCTGIGIMVLLDFIESTNISRQLEAPALAHDIPPEPVDGELNGTSKKPTKKGKSAKKTTGKKK